MDKEVHRCQCPICQQEDDHTDKKLSFISDRAELSGVEIKDNRLIIETATPIEDLKRSPIGDLIILRFMYGEVCVWIKIFRLSS